jgi:hypothetical protein
MPIDFQNITITGGLQLVSAGAAPPSGDPDWANVSLLMNTTSTNAQTNNTFLDSSSAALSISRFGSSTQGSVTPFTVASGSSYNTATNGGSSSFSGGGEYLKSAASAGLSFNGDFTIECWVKTSTISLDPYGRRVWSFGSGLDTSILDLGFYNGSSITSNACLSAGSLGAIITGTIAVADGNWHHVAVTRSGSSIKLFVDGVQSGSTYTSSATFSAGSANGMYISSIGGVGGYLVGNISSLRVVKGTAVYTSAFTPPTSPLTAISGTSLLLNFTNAGMYDAATKNNLTGLGDTKVSTTQSKFAPTSVFFDGTGDSLQTPSSAILYPTISDDFTAEMWAYPATPQEFAILMGFNSSTVSAPWVLRISFSTLEIILGNSSITQGTVTVGQWNHIAFTKSGSTVRLFLNGVQQGSNATVSSITVGGMNFTIGDWSNGGRPFNGYIQDVRITKGVARYTANFTPPTAAFPTN